MNKKELSKIQKERRKSIVNAILDSVLYLFILLDSFAIIKIPDVLFLVPLFFVLIIYVIGFFWLVMITVLKKENHLKEILFSKEPSLQQSTSRVILAVIEYIMIGIILVNQFVGSGKCSWLVTWALIMQIALTYATWIMSSLLRKARNSNNREAVILSFKNLSPYNKLVDEYVSIKEAMLLEGTISNKELQKELMAVQKEYYSLIRA